MAEAEFREAFAQEAQRQARGDDGRFTRAEAAPAPAAVEDPTPVEEQTAAPEEAAAAPPPEGERLLAGKYKTAEDLEAAYTSLESRLGQQGQELGDLRQIRQQMDELRAELAQIAQPAAQPVTDAETVDWFDQVTEQNPGQAAQWAVDNQQWHLYDRAMEAWFEVQPRAAAAYDTNMRIAASQWQMQQQLAAQTAPLAHDVQAREFAHAIQNVNAEFPEFTPDVFAEQVIQAAAEAPWIADALNRGTLESKQQVLRSLALMARGRNADTLVAHAQQTGRMQAEEARRDKTEAGVASAATSPAREAPTGVDAWRDAFRSSAEFRKAQGLR